MEVLYRVGDLREFTSSVLYIALTNDLDQIEVFDLAVNAEYLTAYPDETTLRKVANRRKPFGTNHLTRLYLLRGDNPPKCNNRNR